MCSKLFENFSDLTPSSEYKFRVKAANRLGETEWTTPVTSWTDDAPLDLSTVKFFASFFYNVDFCLVFSVQLSKNRLKEFTIRIRWF